MLVYLLMSLLALLAGFLLAAVAIGLALSSPQVAAPPSDHFDGQRFHHPWPAPERGLGDMLKWVLSRERGPWPEDLPNGPVPAPPKRVSAAGPRLTHIGHATWFVQLETQNLLTDPIFADRAGPFAFSGPKRHRAPALRLEELPPIDTVLISHNHYDHLNLPSLLALEAAHHPLFITGLGNGWVLKNAGLRRVVELDWWQSRELPGGLRATFVPAQHFSQRGLFDRNRTLWGGFVLEGTSARLYFAGDTGYGPHFAEIAKRLGPPSVALLPIGAFRPRWFMAVMHLSPQDAVKAFRELGAKEAVVMHYGVFRPSR